MEQCCVPGAGKTLRPGVSREQAMIYLLALAKDKPVIVNRVAALMKVTTAAANVNKTLWLGFYFLNGPLTFVSSFAWVWDNARSVSKRRLVTCM